MSNNPFDFPPNTFSSKPAETMPDAEPATPPPPSRKFRIGNDKDRLEMYELIKLKTLHDNAAELHYRQDAPSRDKSVVTYDEKGNVSGTTHSIMCGTKATNKNQADLIKALRAEVYRNHGIKK